MVLVDTSVWIDHFRKGEPVLEKLLTDGFVLIHPFIIGELACGNLQNRTQILDYLSFLPAIPAIDHDEVLFFFEQHQIMGRGLGYIDVCLLAAVTLAGGKIWTKDARLQKAAADLNLDSKI